jgi:hypothetical protein
MLEYKASFDTNNRRVKPMSDQNKEDLNSEAVPFFARFLEGQSAEEMCDEEMEAVAGGKRAVTRKYPSDNDEGWGGGGGMVTTMKYPSDQEDGGGGGAVTLKYPSDGDDYIAQ